MSKDQASPADAHIGTFASLYSGAGGLDLGFVAAGFQAIWANDADAFAVETYNKLLPAHVANEGPIEDQELPTRGSVDLVIGGPPRCLTRWGDPGLAELVRSGKYEDARFPDALVEALVGMIRGWAPTPAPTWITWIPSSRGVVDDFAHRLGHELGLDVVDSVRRVREREPQKSMENSCQQARNVVGAFEVVDVRGGPVLLIDDMVDSRWTFTITGAQLRAAGSGPVYPVALADTSRGGD